MNKTLIWVIALVVVLIGGMAAVRIAGPKPTGSEGTELSKPVSEADHSVGEGDMILVEYSDFQCPACATYEPALKQLVSELPNDVKLVYRHFPLRNAHQNAQLAAQASEAAHLHGKFWEMHDMLFAKQNEWATLVNPTETFASYATELGLDVEKFKTDLTSEEMKDIVNSDYESGIDSKVNSTPTFFLNGKKISNPRNYDELKALILNAKNSAENS